MIIHRAIGLSTVGAVAGIVSVLAGPAAPIVVPIVAGVVVAKWVYDVYKLSYVPLLMLIERSLISTYPAQRRGAPALYSVHC